MTENEFYIGKSRELVNLAPHVGVRMFELNDSGVASHVPVFGCLADAVEAPSDLGEPKDGCLLFRYSEPRANIDELIGLLIEDFKESSSDPEWWGALKNAVMSEFLERRQNKTGEQFAPA